MGRHSFTAPSYSELSDALADAIAMLEERLPERHAALIRLQNTLGAAESKLATDYLAGMPLDRRAAIERAWGA